MVSRALGWGNSSSHPFLPQYPPLKRVLGIRLATVMPYADSFPSTLCDKRTIKERSERVGPDELQNTEHILSDVCPGLDPASGPERFPDGRHTVP